MHYLMLISDRPQMVFHTEFLMRTIETFSPDPSQDQFSIIVNGESKSDPFKSSLKLEKYTLQNEYIQSKAEALFCPYHWSLPVPSRWFIEPKAETCVFVDVDMIAINDLTPLYQLDKNSIHGVLAYDQTLKIENKDLYFNFGMLSVPSKYKLEIGKAMMEKVPEILTTHGKYFAGQIALAYVLKDLNIPTSQLPRKFNWIDNRMPNRELNSALFLHYIVNRTLVTCPETIGSISLASGGVNKIYAEIIENNSKKFWKPKKLFV